MAHPLVEARKQANLSQEALARMIGKSRITIVRIENRQQEPSMETASRIISALRDSGVEFSADGFISQQERAA